MHDPSHPLYLPLRLLHILGAILYLGGLLAALHFKVGADRSADPVFAAHAHRRLRKLDGQFIGPGALLTFAAGYAMVRFLGGRIAQHGFVLWGLVVMFVSLGVWYFGVRRLNERLADEAEVSVGSRSALSLDYAKKSAAWVGLMLTAIALVFIVLVMMVFKLPSA